ncbi:MAG: hypothetical protein ACSHYB_09395 [Roseibacillus sp.]
MDTTDELLEHLTAPLEGNAEAALSTQDLMGPRIRKANEGAVHSALVRIRLHQTPSPRPKKLFLFGPLVIVLVTLVLVALTGASLYQDFRYLRAALRGDGDVNQAVIKSLTKRTQHLSDEQRLFLLGDPDEQDPTLRFKKAYEQDPSNPATLSDHLLARSNSYPRKPSMDELLGLARKGQELDPQNALFFLVEASLLFESSLEADPTYRGSRSPPGTFHYRVTDSKDFHHAVGLLKEAATLPHFTAYSVERTHDRSELFPSPQNTTEFQENIIYQSQLAATTGSGYLRLRSVLEIVTFELSQNGDQEGLRELYQNALRITELQSSEPAFQPQLSTTLFTLSGLSRVYQSLKANGHLSTKHALAVDALDTSYKEIRDLQGYGNYAAFGSDHGGFYSSRESYWISIPGITLTTVDDLEPERTLWQLTLEKFYLTCAALLCLLLAPFFLFLRPPGTKNQRKMTATLSGLYPARDYFGIAALTVGLAALWYLFITRLTPLGCRDYGLGWRDTLPVGPQVGAAVLLMLCLIIWFNRHIFHRRLASIGLSTPARKLDWLFILPVALILPLYGILRYLPFWPTEHQMFWPSFLAFPALTYLSVKIFRSSFTLLENRLARFFVAKSIGHSLLFAAFLLACLLPILTHQTNRAVQRDTFFAAANSGPYTTRQEQDFYQEYTREIHALVTEQLELLESGN